MDWIRHLATRTSLFYRILIASSGIVLVGAVAGTWITRSLPQGSPLQLIAGFVLAGVALHVVANYWILKAAMKPLISLQGTVDEVHYKGNLKARAVPEPMGDPATNRLIAAVNDMLEQLDSTQRELQRLPIRVLEAQEEERKRIARELHDETSQALTSVIVGLKTLERVYDLHGSESGPAQEMVGQLRATVASTLEAVHRMAVELRPSALDELGLIPALRAYAKEYEAKFQIKVDLEIVRLKRRLPPEVEVAVYRVVQEALTNTAKHSAASRVAVRLQIEGSDLAVKVQDDGRGFDLAEVRRSKDGGLGLFGMKERAMLLSGRLEIRSTPGTGTVVEARVPLESDHQMVA